MEVFRPRGRRPGNRGEHGAVRELLALTRPHWRILALAVLLGLLGSAAGLVQPLLARAVINSLSDGKTLVGPVLALSGVVLVGAFLSGFTNWLLQSTAEQVVRRTRSSLGTRLIRLRIGELDRQAPGDLISRVTADSSLVRSAATNAMVDLVNGGLSLLGAIVLMGVLDLRLLGVTLVVLVVFGFLIGYVVPRVRRAWKRAQEAVGALGAALDRVLGAARTVKASGAEAAETVRVDAATDEAYRAGLRGVLLNSVISVVSAMSIQIPFLVVLGFGGAFVARGSLDVATLVAFLLYLFYLIGPIGQVVSGITTLQQGLGALDRVRELQAMETEDDVDGAAPAPPPDGPLPVRFDGVGFAYAGRDPVLRQVSFDAPAPGLTAIVGPSGAGKSTLFSLLMRFHEAGEGRITIGGDDVAELSRRGLRQLIGYVEQDAPVLSGTMRENLLYAAPDASAADVADVLVATRLDGFVASLADGLDTLVGTRGVLLSGGERQRLAIARALLRRPRVLLLDEATSQLDARNEQALREVVQQVAATRTVLAVAHRLSTVTAADRIVVLDAGRVRAVGTHAELLAGDPLYAELAATQLLTPAEEAV